MEAKAEPGSAGPRSWIGTLGDALEAVERTAWDLRALAQAAADRAEDLRTDAERRWQRAERDWQQIERDWKRVDGDLRALGRELGRWPSRASRLGEAGWMLARLTAAYRLHRTHAAFLSERAAGERLERLHAGASRLFAETAARRGAGLLKVGQLLSTRPDLLPPVWIRELSKLQDAAPPFPVSAVRQRIEEDLGRPPEALFAAFEDAPLAAASIGQVHRARTLDGREVAVKVARPGIDEWIEIDLDLLELFLEAVRPLFPPSDTATVLCELRTMLRQELDYQAEARMMARVGRAFAERPGIRVPPVVPELCGRHVLVSEYVAGRKITEVLDALHTRREQGDPEAGRRLDGILERLLESYVRQILVDGVFQADPHPGNFLVTERDELVLLDFGATRVLETPVRDRYLALVGAFLGGRTARVGELLGELGFATASGEPATLETFAELLLGEFRRAMAGGRLPEAMDPQAILAQAREALETSRQDPVIRIPGEFVMIARVFLSLGGLFQHYRPDVSLARPVLAVLAGRA